MTMMDKIKETVVFLQEQGVKEVDFGFKSSRHRLC